MLVAQVKNVELQGHITKIELHDSITTVDYGDVAKNGLPSMMGTWLMPYATSSVSRTTKSTR